jgi:predicted nucleic acid-binding protein
MLIDTDVLVWQSRGHIGAAERLYQIPIWQISVTTYIELVQGALDKTDHFRLRKALAQRNTIIIPISPTISQLAAALIDEFALSHGLRLADALIAATAIELQTTLISANTRHFKQISSLDFEPFFP